MTTLQIDRPKLNQLFLSALSEQASVPHLNFAGSVCLLLVVLLL